MRLFPGEYEYFHIPKNLPFFAVRQCQKDLVVAKGKVMNDLAAFNVSDTGSFQRERRECSELREGLRLFAAFARFAKFALKIITQFRPPLKI